MFYMIYDIYMIYIYNIFILAEKLFFSNALQNICKKYVGIMMSNKICTSDNLFYKALTHGELFTENKPGSECESPSQCVTNTECEDNVCSK